VRAFFGFVKKEVFHVLRDRRTLLVLFGLPLVEMTLFGYALRNEVRNAPTVLVDPAGDALSRAIAQSFRASENFRVVATLPAVEPARRLLEGNGARLVVVLPAELEARVGRGERPAYQLLTDGSEPNTARTLSAYATAILERHLTEATGRPAAAPRLEPAVRMAFNPGLESTYLFVPGLMAVILTLVCALMTSVTITREKELGTMEVLLVSPLRPVLIVIGKVMPYLGVSLFNVALILGLARFAFAVPIRGSVVLLVAESLLFSVCVLSLGVLVSTKAETQQAATTASLSSLMFPTILLSGFLFPIESLPKVLQWLSVGMPARWFVEIARGIMLKGAGMAELWQETLILAGMSLFLLTVALANFKTRLE
jgi:ABC-2 type transport system permease protein